MPITGEAKRIYQREYMRRKRASSLVVRPTTPDVRPVVQPKTPVKVYFEGYGWVDKPELDADGNVLYEA